MGPGSFYRWVTPGSEVTLSAQSVIGRCVIEKVLSVWEEVDWVAVAGVSDGKDWT